jgi:ribosomal protein S18 acetylase RimI-like enzyme
VSAVPWSVERLAAHHVLDGFDCGVAAETEWLLRHARQAQAAGTAVTWVACDQDRPVVRGYYTLCNASVAPEQATARATAGAGRYPIPAVLLARLGVDRQAQGRGLGGALLRDALKRTAKQAEQVGVRVVLVHAENDEAKEWYQWRANFEPMPGNPLHLMLLMKDLRRTLAES